MLTITKTDETFPSPKLLTILVFVDTGHLLLLEDSVDSGTGSMLKAALLWSHSAVTFFQARSAARRENAQKCVFFGPFFVGFYVTQKKRRISGCKIVRSFGNHGTCLAEFE